MPKRADQDLFPKCGTSEFYIKRYLVRTVVTCKSYLRPELAVRPPDEAFSPQRIEYCSSFSSI
jgi:hypothetical protein